MFTGVAFVVATRAFDCAGSTRTMAPPWLLAAMAMLPRMRKASPAEHLLLGQLGVASDELADAPGELLVVGHGDERTDRRPRGRELSCATSYEA
jgi:hypothetical protein